MKDFINGFNKMFESRIRLSIMSLLAINEKVDFNTLKESLDISDGNLASHINALETEGYLQVKKSFIGKKPNTQYVATRQGKKAFNDHLDVLEKFLNNR